MIRDELKCSGKNVILFHFFMDQFCIVKTFLLVTLDIFSLSLVP
jgi:hypothetical protein